MSEFNVTYQTPAGAPRQLLGSRSDWDAFGDPASVAPVVPATEYRR